MDTGLCFMDLFFFLLLLFAIVIAVVQFMPSTNNNNKLLKKDTKNVDRGNIESTMQNNTNNNKEETNNIEPETKNNLNYNTNSTYNSEYNDIDSDLIYGNIILKNRYGATKIVPFGFSWTTLFFGFFVPLFRGDIKYFFIMIVASIFSYGISNLVFPFFYNDIYLSNLLENGWKPKSEIDKEFLKQERKI